MKELFPEHVPNDCPAQPIHFGQASQVPHLMNTLPTDSSSTASMRGLKIHMEREKKKLEILTGTPLLFISMVFVPAPLEEAVSSSKRTAHRILVIKVPISAGFVKVKIIRYKSPLAEVHAS